MSVHAMHRVLRMRAMMAESLVLFHSMASQYLQCSVRAGTASLSLRSFRQSRGALQILMASIA
eukprot:76669-Alexandrium_andersonii.AAC.1